MPTFETFIKPIWDRRDWLQYLAALWQQNFSSSFEMKFPFWQNNHFGKTSCPLLRLSSSLFGTGETNCNIQLPCGNKILHQASRWNFHFDKIIILARHHAYFWDLHQAYLGQARPTALWLLRLQTSNELVKSVKMSNDVFPRWVLDQKGKNKIWHDGWRLVSPTGISLVESPFTFWWLLYSRDAQNEGDEVILQKSPWYGCRLHFMHKQRHQAFFSFKNHSWRLKLKNNWFREILQSSPWNSCYLYFLQKSRHQAKIPLQKQPWSLSWRWKSEEISHANYHCR